METTLYYYGRNKNKVTDTLKKNVKMKHRNYAEMSKLEKKTINQKGKYTK